MHDELIINISDWRDHFIAQTHPVSLTLMAALKAIKAETATRLNAEQVASDALIKRNLAEKDRALFRAALEQLANDHYTHPSAWPDDLRKLIGENT